MNSENVLSELKEKRQEAPRLRWRVIYVSNAEELSILNDACRLEWIIAASQSDFKGGVFYTLKRNG